MFVTTEQVLSAYIRTGLRPLHGKQAFAVDADGQDLRSLMYDTLELDKPEDHPAVAACPIGVLCIDRGHKAFQVESGSFGEHYYDRENHDGNTCWTDGFISAWEETQKGKGYEPQAFDYTPEENPDGLEIYKRGYANGQHIREDFIRLGLRSA